MFGTDVLVHVALTEETLTTNTDPLTSAHLLFAYEVLGPTVDPGDMLTECWFTDRLVFAEPTLNIVALLSSLTLPLVVGKGWWLQNFSAIWTGSVLGVATVTITLIVGPHVFEIFHTVRGT